MIRDTSIELEILNKKWAAVKPLLERRQEIRSEKAQIFKEAKRITTTKKFMIFLFCNFTAIELFTGYLMWKQMEVALATGIAPNMQPQITLISVVVAEVLNFGIYAVKSLKENTAGGVEYLNAQAEINANKFAG